ncbi:hypothetical protein QBE52_05320 [Clostridiaceae bacterium 35-E11]
MQHEIDNKKHYHNLLKAVEGTGWILCDAIHTMAENNIVPDKHYQQNNRFDAVLAQHISEIFEVIAECEEPEVIDYIADKMLEYAGTQPDQLVNYLEKYMGDNPLYKRILENNRLPH